MYYGIKRAVHRVDAAQDLAAVLTGTGDGFAPGGDLGGRTEHHEEPAPEGLTHEMIPFLTISRDRGQMRRSQQPNCSTSLGRSR
jgi:enoyl-CoA hydratase